MLDKIGYYLGMEGVILFLIIILILLYYLRKNTNPMVFIITLVMWFFNAFIIVILPYDIFLSNYEEEKSSKVDLLLGRIRILYAIIYWSISLCSSLLIPFISKYEECGYFTRGEKIIYSIKTNLKFYAILLLLGIILLIWAYFKLSQETKTYFIKNCFNFSYIYGFFFLVLLLGYSLPRLPLNIYNKIFYKKTLKELETNTKILKRKLEKINKDLLDCYYKLVSIQEKIKINKELKSKSKLKSLNDKIKDKETEENKIKKYEIFLNEKINYIKKNEKALGITIKKNNLESEEEFGMEDIPEKIASLNIRLKDDKWDNLRIQCQLQSLYNEWCYMKTIVIKGKKYKSIIEQDLRDSKVRLMGKKEEFIPLKNISTLKILYYMKIHPLILFFFSFLFFILGIVIMLSELCICLPWKISIFNIISHFKDNVFFTQLFIIGSVFIFFLMSLYALMNFKLTKNYRMYGPRQTDAISILYFTNNFCRIIFPLSLNILLMMDHGKDKIKETCLENDFGINIHNQIFALISKYSPLVLLFFVFLNMFGIFSKIIDCFSMETISSFFFDNSNENINEGYEYLIDINKKNKGKLLTDSIMDKLNED